MNIAPLASTIPPEASLVFTGEIFSVYQWPQILYDGSISTFEKLKRPDTVVIIAVTEEKEIIILEQEQPQKPTYTGFPGGRIEPGEEIIDAAKRELLEETGFTSNEFSLLKAYQPSHKIDWSVYLLVAKQCKKIAEQKLDAGEKISVSKVSFETIIALITGEQFESSEFTTMILRGLFNKEEMKQLTEQLGLYYDYTD